MKSNVCQILKVVAFLGILFILLIGANGLVRPSGCLMPDSYNTVYGFYQEPKNSIQVAFLGPSHVGMTFIPMEMYSEYGISSYNLGTSAQPMMASYYLLEELYKLHQNSLSTVVLEVSRLKSQSSQSEYQFVLDEMRYSTLRVRAWADYAGGFQEFVNFYFPLLSYHGRWDDLKERDFVSANNRYKEYSKGYTFTVENWIYNSHYDEINVLTPKSHFLPEEEQVEFQEESMDYLNRIIRFCDDHGLRLILIKIPTMEGTDAWNNWKSDAIRDIADNNDLEFIDFNMSPCLDELFELGYNALICSYNEGHPNYYGGKYITKWIGRHLADVVPVASDVPKVNKEHLPHCLEQYNDIVKRQVDLDYAVELRDYVDQALLYENVIAIMSTSGDASEGLDPETRQWAYELGLVGLAELDNDEDYVSILTEGIPVLEIKNDLAEFNASDDPDSSGESEFQGELRVLKDELCQHGIQMKDLDIDQETYLTGINTKIVLPDGHVCIIESGHDEVDGRSSIRIDQVEFSENIHGINIVLYDYDHHTVIDHTSFETFAFTTRRLVTDRMGAYTEGIQHAYELPDNLRNIYYYNRRVEDALLTESMLPADSYSDLRDYLKPWTEREGYTIYLSAQGDQDLPIDRKGSWERACPVIEIIDDGNLQLHNADINGQKIEYDLGDVSACSSFDGLTDSSIRIGQEEYCLGEEGINVVVYDKRLCLVVFQGTYPSYESF